MKLKNVTKIILVSTFPNLKNQICVVDNNPTPNFIISVLSDGYFELAPMSHVLCPPHYTKSLTVSINSQHTGVIGQGVFLTTLSMANGILNYICLLI